MKIDSSVGIGTLLHIITLIVIIGGFGVWVGKQDEANISLKENIREQKLANRISLERIDTLEIQLLVWFDDAEIQAKKDKADVLEKIDKNREKIRNTNNFLIRKFPEYQTYD
jgi:hypothetical protein